jgi:hypothetical protein
MKKEAEIFKIQRLYSSERLHVERKNKSDTRNNKGNWNHLRVIQKMPEQRTGKARHQGTAQKKTAIPGTGYIIRKVLM